MTDKDKLYNLVFRSLKRYITDPDVPTRAEWEPHLIPNTVTTTDYVWGSKGDVLVFRYGQATMLIRGKGMPSTWTKQCFKDPHAIDEMLELIALEEAIEDI